MDECPICWKALALHTLGCGHSFCSACLHRQLNFDARCALCRQTITTCDPGILAPCPASITIHFKKSAALMGIRMTTVEASVFVTHVERNSLGDRIGLKVMSRIHGINDVPCYRYECVQQMFRGLQDQHVRITLVEPLPKRNRLRRLTRLWSRTL